MSQCPDPALEALSADALRRLVLDLLERLHALESRVAELQDQLETAKTVNAALQVENQKLRDEIARLKNLPQRPHRSSKRDKNNVTREEVLTVEVPSGSCFKGYETILIRELVLSPELVQYRRERWLTPDGKTIVAPLPDGMLGGFGANLRRFCLVMHHEGQVTTGRLTSILNGIGMDISKRQIVRLLTSGLADFIAEDRAVLQAGLASAAYISVDDTDARHLRLPGITTQIGGANFSVFRTGRTKSRRNFLSLLRAGGDDYVINAEALVYMRDRKLAPGLITRLGSHPHKLFASEMAWYAHLLALPMDIFDRDLLRTVSEAALWGAVRQRGMMGNTVVVSDDAGQFRVPNHGLCWVHAERLVQKLMPKTQLQARRLEEGRKLIWELYRDLKAWKHAPATEEIAALGKRFDDIFSQHTGYKELDQLLTRLHRRKPELLKVLERPEIPLHTNASENDLRACVIKRKISGGTMSENGRLARDVLLGLMKTCRKLGISFFAYLGDRLGINPSSNQISPLPELVACPTA